MSRCEAGITDNRLVSMQAKDTTVTDLSNDLLHTVFSLLDLDDISRASVVCRRWRTIGSNEDFWQILKFEYKLITEPRFAVMCNHHQNIVSVNLCYVPDIVSLAVTAVSLLRNLEVLMLSYGTLSGTFFQAMTQCSKLKNLTINRIFLPGISIIHTKLCLLQVLDCIVSGGVTISCPMLETLSLNSSTMSRVVLHTPLIRNLDIAECEKLGDIPSVVTSCPLLESLNMAHTHTTNGTLRDIASSCMNLRILDVSYCLISLESVWLPMLTVLILQGCKMITSASLAGISHSYALETLKIIGCTALTSLALYLPHLQNIKIDHCYRLVDLTLQSSLLSSVNVSNCSLQRVSITARTLRKLVLQKHEELTTLTLRCECLEEVDLTGCEALTNSICKVFSDGGGCPMLKSITLDNCKSLEEVFLHSSTMVKLSLVNCRAIKSIILNCPFLEQVSLDGCVDLKKASFSPVGLKFLNLGIISKLEELEIEASQLASLQMSRCGLLSEASINCPQLISLDASSCSQVKNQLKNSFLYVSSSSPLIESEIPTEKWFLINSRLFLQRLQRLTYLDLSYTYLVELQPVFESCMHLKVLKLQSCKCLVDRSLDPLFEEGALPVLSELDLSFCTFSRLSIERVLTRRTLLTHVNLSGCVNTGDIELRNQQEDMYMIQVLNCVGCLNINKFVIPLTTWCLNLSSVNLSLSQNLRELDLVCSNLCSLNLSKCGSLEILKLKCPKLSSLFLQSCNIAEEVVREAISSCSMLQTLDVRFCSKIYIKSKGKLLETCPTLKRLLT